MSKQAMWVPGYVAAAEHVGGGGLGSVSGPLRNYDGPPPFLVPPYDYQDVVGFRQGFGVHFRGKAEQKVWFHFAIPTPVITDNFRVSLVRAFVLWSTRGGSQLSSFYVWDGDRQPPLLALTHLGLSGIYDGGPTMPGSDPKLVAGANMFTLPEPQPVFYGVGVSVLIVFAPQGDDSDVFFSSAGADFMT